LDDVVHDVYRGHTKLMVPRVLWKYESTFSLLLKISWLKVRKQEWRRFATKVEVKNTYYVCKKENRFEGDNFNSWTRRGVGKICFMGKYVNSSSFSQPRRKTLSVVIFTHPPQQQHTKNVLHASSLSISCKFGLPGNVMKYLLFAVLLWLSSFHLLSHHSKVCPPPNTCQILVYHKVFGGKRTNQIYKKVESKGEHMMRNTYVLIFYLGDEMIFRLFDSQGQSKESVYLSNDTLFILYPGDDEVCLHSLSLPKVTCRYS
jgi:hypothetical protein